MKTRQAIPETASLPEEYIQVREDGGGGDDIQAFEGIIKCHQPNGHLYEFNSSIDITMTPENIRAAGVKAEKRLKALQQELELSQSKAQIILPTSNSTYSLSSRQLLLQATFLRNTTCAYGLCVYTGNETKFGKNKRDPPTKWTKLDRVMNKCTIFIFFFQMTLAIGLGIYGSIHQDTEVVDVCA